MSDDLVVTVPLEKLLPWCPFNQEVWAGMTRPLTREEVQVAIDQEAFIRRPLPERVATRIRRRHVGRVAFLAVQGWGDPIEVDVGVPSLGCHVGWPIADGNHRVAAAFFRGDPTIQVGVSGSLDYFQELFEVTL